MRRLLYVLAIVVTVVGVFILFSGLMTVAQWTTAQLLRIPHHWAWLAGTAVAWIGAALYVNMQTKALEQAPIRHSTSRYVAYEQG